MASAVLTLVGETTLLVPVTALPPLDTLVWIGPEVDRVAHVVMSLGAVVLWAWATPRLPLAALAMLAVAIAAGTEVVQMLPSILRTPEVEDFAFNLIGIAVGIGLLLLVRGARSGRPVRR